MTYMTPNVFINYVGFEPSQDDKNFLNLKLSQLNDISPSNSTITIDFIKESGRILGVQKIFFGEKPFSALCENPDFRMLVLEISKKIQIQVAEWRKDRFTQTEAAV